MKSPIHQHEDKWYFWGEVWWEGPYETKKECELALQEYYYRLEAIKLMKRHALTFRNLTLSSGTESSYYIDCRMISTLKEGAPLLADLIKEKIGNLQVDAIGGPEIGAIPILGALSGKGYFNTFIIRKGPKKYGLNKLIEGQLNEQDSSVIIIDDVATTGKSILRAINTVKKVHPNIKILKVIVIVDREEGAKEYLKEFGYSLEHLFTGKELIGELNG